MTTTAYYKIVGPAGEPMHGGSGAWPLPIDGQPGAWREVSGPIVPCTNGLHLTTREHLHSWIPRGQTFTIYRAEVDGEVVDAGEKVAARRVRLLPRTVDHPAPDMPALDAAKARAYERAERAYKRAMRPAPSIPDRWRTYLDSIGSAKLPAGHPGAVYAAPLAAWQAMKTAAEGARYAAQRAAAHAYQEAVDAAMMPD